MSDTMVSPTRMVATTPWSASDWACEQSRRLANWFDCDWVQRNNRSIIEVCEDEQVDVVVIGDLQPKLYHRLQPGVPVFFHPGMAMQRLLRLSRGEDDRLLKAAAVAPGDVVLDATLGLGADALVLSEAVGQTGHVMACEASWPLARLFAYAVVNRLEQPDWLSEPLGRIRVQPGSHESVLSGLPPRSVDVVYFDPMFRTPSAQQSSIDVIRPFAMEKYLTDTAFERALVVARRSVVVKERFSSGVFQRYNLVPDKPKARFAYGVRYV